MSNEIDRLEIVVETEARRANRALSGMEKRINKIADSLEKVINLSSSLNKLGEFDLRGFEKVQNEINSMMNSVKGLGRKNVSPKVDDSDIKYTTKSLDELYDKFKDVGKNTDLSGIKLADLQKGLKNAESTVERLNERLDKKISLEGTDKLGKSLESLIYDIQKATNQAEAYREAISRIKREVPKFTIDRGETTSSSDNSQKVTRVSSESLGYNPDAMKAVFGEGAESLRNFDDVMKKFGGNSASAAKAINEFDSAMDTRKINTYEAQIKRLKTELAELGMKGFKQGDKEYDSVAKKLAKVTAEKKKYDKSMRDSVNADAGLKKTNKSLNDIRKTLNRAGNGIIKFGRSTTKVFGNAIQKAVQLKNAIFGVQKQSNKGMSLGRMIGSSMALSFVFQGISKIQNAIKEGSDNLTQYSSEYNNSISGIVSSLTYLKNAWASAFAPIFNVVAPYLQAFVDMVARALNMIGQFFAALTGKGFAVQAKKVWQDYGAGIAGTGGAADDTNGKLKELKKTILGFDQLNMLTDNSDLGSGSDGSSGSGGGEVSPSDMFQTIETQSAISDFARRLREAFLSEDWKGLGKILADGVNTGFQYLYDAINWKNVGPKITYFCNAFTTTFNSLVDNIKWDLIGRTVGAGINTIVNTANLFMERIDWISLGTKFAVGLNGAFREINWLNIGVAIGNYFMISWKTFYGFLGELDFDAIGRSFGQSLNGAFSRVDFPIIGSTIARGLNGIAKFIIEFFKTVDWNQFTTNFSNGLNSLVSDTDWESVGVAINTAFLNILDSLSIIAQEVNWREFGKAIGEMLSQIDWWSVFSETATILKEVMGGLIDGLSETVGGKVVLFIAGLALAFKGGSVLLSVGTFVGGIRDKFNVLKDVFSMASTGATGATKSLGSAASSSGKSLDIFGGGISGLKGKLLNSAGWTIFFHDNIKQLGKVSEITTFGSLEVALSELRDEGIITDSKFNDLYSTLESARSNSVPFEDAMVYVRDELDKSGVKSKEFEDKLSDALDALGVSAPKKAKIIGTGIGDGTQKGIDESIKKVEEAIKRMASKIIDKFKDMFGIHSPSRVFAQLAQYCGEGFSNNLNSAFRSAFSFFSSIPSKIRDSLGNLWNIGRNAINDFINGFSVNIPLPHINIGSRTYNIGKASFSIPTFEGISWYAKGGFPAMGEMFIANEKGPELVGKMGRRNVVANNNQITSGIKAAVIEGLMEVFMATDGFGGSSQAPQTIYVEVKTENDEVLARAVKRGNEKLDYRYNPSPAY